MEAYCNTSVAKGRIPATTQKTGSLSHCTNSTCISDRWRESS